MSVEVIGFDDSEDVGRRVRIVENAKFGKTLLPAGSLGTIASIVAGHSIVYLVNLDDETEDDLIRGYGRDQFVFLSHLECLAEAIDGRQEVT